MGFTLRNRDMVETPILQCVWSRITCEMICLKDPNAFPPALKSRIEVNLIGEGVCLAGGNRGDMVLVFIDDGHNLHGRFL